MKYPQFLKEEDFFELHDGLTEMELLKKFSNNLKTIHNLTTSHYCDFSSLINEYLIAGAKIFNMEFGIISSVVGDDYIVCDAISPNNELVAGARFDVEGTYCREVIKTKKIIGLPHVGSIEEMKGHPVYQNMKLESYLSAPIFKDDVIFGTLNFSSTKIRKYGFSEYERELISMLANSIGNYLRLIDKEENLQSANRRIRKLTGYLAHDLRTPLGNIFSLACLIPDSEESVKVELLEDIKDTSSKAMEIVDTVLEAAIIGDGKISLDRRKYLLGDILMDSIKDFETYPNHAHLVIDKSIEEVSVSVDRERMFQVFSNLLSNSLKYALENSSISISIKKVENFVSFEISNPIGNKINDFGREIEQKSSGFGLEIVDEILKLHSSKLIITNENQIFSASFLLQL